MNWPEECNEIDKARFEPFKPREVLYDFDGPRIFTFLNSDAELFLAYQCEQNSDAWRYLVVPFSQRLTRRLTAGDISVRDALEQPRMWVVDVDKSWRLTVARQTDIEELPEDALPKQGTMLWLSQEPLVSQESVMTPVGRIREVDLDRSTFDLRDLEDSSGSIRFTFEENLEENVLGAVFQKSRIRVRGLKEASAAYPRATAIEELPDRAQMRPARQVD